MDTALAEAFIHGRHSVCGFDLAPFTLRHAFVLDALENPLALGSTQPVTYADLFRAARFCSAQNEAQMQDILLTPASDEEAQKYAADATAHYEAFSVYLKDFITAPRLLEAAGGGRYQCHPLLIIAVKLIQNGFDETRAWWTPYAAARWYSLALDDLNPHASFRILDERLENSLRRLGHKV
jgi:hypothetical protein